MYSSKFAVAIKNAGKILRETSNSDAFSVALPFGAEYQIHLKNMNSVRALVKVEIDGVDATGGTRLIVPANGVIDLERFIKENDTNIGNRFKFIERSAKIENGPRGIRVEDGLVRVEFEFEREPTPINDHQIRHQLLTDTYFTKHLGGSLSGHGYTTTNAIGDTWLNGGPRGQITYSANSASASGVSGVASGALGSTTHTFTPSSVKQAAFSAQVNDVGITVPGSISEQKFVQGAWFPTDGVKHVMVLKIVGELQGKLVEVPVTVKAKPTCVTCGTVNKGNAKFCRECGTALTVV